jgi:hypothetical protein
MRKASMVVTTIVALFTSACTKRVPSRRASPREHPLQALFRFLLEQTDRESRQLPPPVAGGREDLRALYTATSDHSVHAQQMRWTILNNFLIGHTIFLLAWTQLFTTVITHPAAAGHETANRHVAVTRP